MMSDSRKSKKRVRQNPLVEEKLKNIEADLDRFEDINQSVTLAQEEQKQFGEKLDNMEAMLKAAKETGLEAKEIDFSVKAFDKFLRKGQDKMEPDEVKALTVNNDTGAGFLAHQSM